jgi:two-component system chemotaxis response regulator CheY
MPATALVVEDEETLRWIAVRLLRRAGFERVDEARDGLEALELLRQNTYAFALVDLRMPRLSGYDLLQLLEAGPLPANPQIIVVTAEHDAGKPGKAFNPAVVAGLMRKPYDVDTLLAIAEACVERHGTEQQDGIAGADPVQHP